ncbi:hypothetical protein GE09DRAFT_1051024 [Coniochaeta sp. 2T2.1]|nr:hypothetical protein GE09DRAFT_1051024 [Coniochaeta sp. 2T2.1]
MSLSLEKQLTFYGAYHHNAANIAIHALGVPLIAATSFTLCTNIGPFFTVPQWLSIPYLEPNLGIIGAFLYAALYILLEPVAGTALGIICVAMATIGNQLRIADATATNQWSIAIFIFSWIIQFIGHGKFEGRAPALFDNLFQAFVLAPLFVWLELLFMIGYRPELKSRVDKAVAVEVAKFRQQKEQKNGKAQ